MRTACEAGASRGNAALRRLATSKGIQTSYRDIDGKTRYADDETLAAVLEALGRPAETAGEQSTDTQLLIEPVMVDPPRSPARVIVHLPSELDPDKVELSLRLEDGSERVPRLAQRIAIPTLPRASYRVELGGRLEPGYHTLEVRADGFSGRALVIAPPGRLIAPDRGWGTFAPLHALSSSARDWGIGSFEQLRQLCEWTRSFGGSFVGTLPVFSEFIDDDGRYAGPYMPTSRLAFNGTLLDIESLPELGTENPSAIEARRLISAPATVEEISRLSSSKNADLSAVWQVKRPVLELLARSADRAAVDRFAQSRPELLAYARFRSNQERHGSSWRSWSSRDQELAGTGVDDTAVRFHLYVQLAAERQLARARSAGGVYLDVPVGVHPSGFDSWSEAESFVPGLSAGAPPDPFFAGGQSWGFSPLHPERIRENGYRYVIAYLRNAMAHSSMVRIDHVMGLHRLWCVPDGFEPSRGAYIRYHADELHAIVALEASRSGTAVVGEDLGTVPAQVRKAMSRDGFLSSFVLQFESTPDDPLPQVRRSSLASLGTHDLPTFRSFWNGWDVTDPPEATTRARWRDAVVAALDLAEDPASGEEGTVRAVLLRLLEYLGASAADLVMVDVEDLLLEIVRQNSPGTDMSEGNFSRRAAETLEEMSDDPYVVECLTTLGRARAIARS
jgi:4-alpha-glucanotransferase